MMPNELSKQDYLLQWKNLDVPLHMSPPWMDAVCMKGDWDICSLLSEKGRLEGILVYHMRKVLGVKFILMPPMCFYNGIKLYYPGEMKNHAKASFEERVVNQLIDKLPSYSFYYQQFPPEFQNWAPFYWRGFSQTTRYTYRIDLSRGKDDLETQLKGNVRRNISKAARQCAIEKVTINDFLDGLALSYRDRSSPFNPELLRRIYHELSGLDSIDLLLCRGKDDNSVQAGVMICRDARCSYYVCGFYNPAYQKVGGLSYLLWSQIMDARTAFFDFEGSMIRDIEYFFRGFGADWIPHSRIWHVDSWLLAPLFKLKFRALLHS